MAKRKSKLNRNAYFTRSKQQQQQQLISIFNRRVLSDTLD